MCSRAHGAPPGVENGQVNPTPHSRKSKRGSGVLRYEGLQRRMAAAPFAQPQEAGMRKSLEEFKNFAFKGNLIDLAVAVVLGVAFGKIVDSLVKHLIMPLVGMLLPGDQGYLGWKIVVGAKEIPYGLFLGEVVNFLIVAFVLYVFIVKIVGLVMKAKDPAPSKQEMLLAEIRDLLKAKKT